MLKPEWRSRLLLIFWLTLLCILPKVLQASHLISVEIRAKPLDCDSRLYEVTLIGFVNTNSGVVFGGDERDILYFGDGQSMAIPEQISEIIDPVLQIGRVQFTVSHVYNAAGTYVLSYSEYARNAGIINMGESALTNFFTETSITIVAGHCDASPYFTVPPVDRACKGVAYFHNPGAVDLDDDSISFGFAVPKRDFGQNVKDYLYPDNAKYYTTAGLNYNRGNESQDGPPQFTIDPVDGTLTWDAPGATGEYALAIKVTSWRYNTQDSVWTESGFSIRDMQVIVQECVNSKPDLSVPDDLCVVAGTLVQFTVRASDPNGDLVQIETFSETLSLVVSPAEITPEGTPQQSTAAPFDTAAIRFTWNTTCAHVKNQPYKIVFKVTDSPGSGPRLVRFKTVLIKVIAPPPEFENVTVNPITRKITLEWKDYICNNLQGIQVWRRVTAYEYDQPECANGMPYFLRYRLLATLPPDSKSYTDDDLAIAAQYCYRIVAVVGDNKISSQISIDTCIIPKPAEAPVITNVSVLETSETNGSIELRWTPPFDIDGIQYPPPYTYKVYRSDGFNKNTYTVVSELALSDTSYVDTNLDTKSIPFEYKIELYVPTLTTDPVDTSSMASSVFLTTESQPGKIRLIWDAHTPWYNYLQQRPFHLIYRSDDGAEGPYVLIDSVDVNEYGFEYIDSGQFQNRPLVEDQVYFYKVLTRGAYGNPGIAEPLENFSQVAGGVPLDSKPPCIPVVTIQKTNCDMLDCSADAYYNTITWQYPDTNCREEGLTYRIFVSAPETGEFVPIATVAENLFQHDHLQSMAKCYTVAAIDAVGNISAQSEPVCNDNCPYFELPNVFTPGTEDGKNDGFVAFGAAKGPSKCARFVKQVDLTVYNRWGNEIYSVMGAVPEEDFIFWDGSSNEGREVGTGIYFYSANVTFDVRDPQQQNRIIKGWVHVIRNH